MERRHGEEYSEADQTKEISNKENIASDLLCINRGYNIKPRDSYKFTKVYV